MVDRFDESAVYMTELALTSRSPLTRRLRYSSSPSTVTGSLRDSFAATSRPRNVVVGRSYHESNDDSFMAPGSVSPASEASFASSELAPASTRSRSLLRIQNRDKESEDRDLSSSSSSEDGSSSLLYPRPLSPSLWLSSGGLDKPVPSQDSSTYCSGVARPVRVHRFSIPSTAVRPSSSVSHSTVRAVDTSQSTASATGSDMPLVYSCESAKAVKMIRVCLPPLPPTRPASSISTRSGRSNVSTFDVGMKGAATASDDTASEVSIPLTRDQKVLKVEKQLSHSKAQQKHLAVPEDPRSSRLSLLSAPSLSSDRPRCSSRASMMSDLSGRSFRPTTPLSVLDENETTPVQGERQKKKWDWMSKAKTKSMYFLGIS